MVVENTGDGADGYSAAFRNIFDGHAAHPLSQNASGNVTGNVSRHFLQINIRYFLRNCQRIFSFLAIITNENSKTGQLAQNDGSRKRFPTSGSCLNAGKACGFAAGFWKIRHERAILAQP
jgi:serine/threonine protein phosphatase PrpC